MISSQPPRFLRTTCHQSPSATSDGPLRCFAPAFCQSPVVDRQDAATTPHRACAFGMELRLPVPMLFFVPAGSPADLQEPACPTECSSRLASDGGHTASFRTGTFKSGAPLVKSKPRGSSACASSHPQTGRTDPLVYAFCCARLEIPAASDAGLPTATNRAMSCNRGPA